MLSSQMLSARATQSIFRLAWAPPRSAATGIYHMSSAAPNKMDLIKQLREKSGAPISDVKSSLDSNDWDIEKAYEALRKKGLAAAAKKASRQATEGLVGLAISGDNGTAAVVEINSETDFVARNDMFRSLVGKVAQAALSLGAGDNHQIDLQQLMDAEVPGGSGQKVSDACAEVSAQVRENIKLRRGFKLHTKGSLTCYLHQSPAPGLGRIASIIALEPKNAADESAFQQVKNSSAVAELGSGLAMHAAGLRPQFLHRESVPAEALEHERKILLEQAIASGKPSAMANKVAEGRLVKYYEENCLLEQKYLMDDSVRVKGAVDRVGKSEGYGLNLSAFLRVQCGEGLEAKKADFAAEVESLAKNT